MQRVSIVLYIAAMFIVAASQLLLKASAARRHSSRLREYLNIHVITAYGFFTLSMAAALYAYRFIPVSLAPILESTAMLFVAVLGRIFLGEKISGQKLAGMIIMLLGIIAATLEF